MSNIVYRYEGSCEDFVGQDCHIVGQAARSQSGKTYTHNSNNGLDHNTKYTVKFATGYTINVYGRNLAFHGHGTLQNPSDRVVRDFAVCTHPHDPKQYTFNTENIPLRLGDLVCVDTSRGPKLAWVKFLIGVDKVCRPITKSIIQRIDMDEIHIRESKRIQAKKLNTLINARVEVLRREQTIERLAIEDEQLASWCKELREL